MAMPRVPNSMTAPGSGRSGWHRVGRQPTDHRPRHESQELRADRRSAAWQFRRALSTGLMLKSAVPSTATRRYGEKLPGFQAARRNGKLAVASSALFSALHKAGQASVGCKTDGMLRQELRAVYPKAFLLIAITGHGGVHSAEYSPRCGRSKNRGFRRALAYSLRRLPVRPGTQIPSSEFRGMRFPAVAPRPASRLPRPLLRK
jgi:hypothetical protein